MGNFPLAFVGSRAGVNNRKIAHSGQRRVGLKAPTLENNCLMCQPKSILVFIILLDNETYMQEFFWTKKYICQNSSYKETCMPELFRTQNHISHKFSGERKMCQQFTDTESSSKQDIILVSFGAFWQKNCQTICHKLWNILPRLIPVAYSCHLCIVFSKENPDYKNFPCSNDTTMQGFADFALIEVICSFFTIWKLFFSLLYTVASHLCICKIKELLEGVLRIPSKKRISPHQKFLTIIIILSPLPRISFDFEFLTGAADFYPEYFAGVEYILDVIRRIPDRNSQLNFYGTVWTLPTVVQNPAQLISSFTH